MLIRNGFKENNKMDNPANDIITEVAAEQNELFPVFLKLADLRVLVVGGGAVALEKLQALATNSPSARIRIVATALKDEVRALLDKHSNLFAEERPFITDDLDNTDIIIVAVNDRAVSERIAAVARLRGILVNVADTPDLCDFYLGSVVRKGNLKLAISTNGKSPTMAKRVREVLEEAIPDELDESIRNLHQIRNRLNGNFPEKVKKLNALTRTLIEKDNGNGEKRWRKVATYSLLAFGLMLVGHFIFSYIPLSSIGDQAVTFYQSLDRSFPIMLLAGFLAQLVDGALGMGYGVTSTSVLLSAGISPAAISGSVHTAEMFASGASGYSHYKFGNVNKKLFKKLVIPGVIGAIIGAILLRKLGDQYADYIRPVLAIYTLILGVKILTSAFRKQQRKKKFKQYGLLAGTGGFLDSFGGGGWGPIVTTTLITKGRTPRYVIGSVSLTEFFVTLASAFTFFVMLGVTHWQTIVGLIVGGLVAAPIAAKLTGKLPRKTSFILLGLLVIFWSVRILVKVL
ncbi:TSUP family transporter [Terrimonas ferruginea]|uniref:TSUP family transporter n=1 Tax=Terrimonas ferruginea TaxID=249 RepID=UPI00040D681C|nr:TSUP family transporter [Terrimonas ferruginea]